MNHAYTQHNRTRQRGFTVLELMTVVGVILVLIGILIPVVNVALRNSKKNAIISMTNAIKTGLQQYEADFSGFPPSNHEELGDNKIGRLMNQWEGGEILTQMMIGHLSDRDNEGTPLDGYQGLGFRANFDKGRVYGPYVDIRSEANITESPITGSTHSNALVFTVVGSGVKTPILYYKGRSSTAFRSGDFDKTASSILGRQGRFNTEENAKLADPPSGRDPDKVVEFLKTPRDKDGPTDEFKDSLRASMNTAKYLLIGAGVDDIFGTEDDVHETGP